MADYWKSNPRHFCDFCKCWTADNKPSREFHEKGKRHQENVKKKLDDLRKKGLADAKQEKETSSYLQQMERAALMKLREDLTENPTLASQYGVQLKQSRWELPVTEDKASSQTEDDHYDEACYSPPVKKKKEEESFSTEKKVPEKETSPEAVEDTLACGKSSEDLPTASTSSGEIEVASIALPTPNELPDEIDISSIALPTTSSTSVGVLEKASKSSPCSTDKYEAADKSSTSASASSATDETQPSVETVPPIRQPRPIQKSAYGNWQKVADDNEQEVDLQLPVDAYKVEQKIIIANEPKIKFREKKVTLVGATVGGPSVGFRKPKAGIQRSIRTSGNTDES